MIHTRKLEFMLSISAAGLKHLDNTNHTKSHNSERVFCGISESFVCQHQPSCGQALVLVYKKLPEKNCSLSNERLPLWVDWKHQGSGQIDKRPSGRQKPKPKQVLRVKGHSVKIHGRNTCRFYRNVRRWCRVSTFTGSLTTSSSSTQQLCPLLTAPLWPAAEFL